MKRRRPTIWTYVLPSGRHFRSGKFRHDGWDRKGVRPRDMRARIDAREWGVRT